MDSVARINPRISALLLTAAGMVLAAGTPCVLAGSPGDLSEQAGRYMKARTCIDESTPVSRRLASCTTLIDSALQNKKELAKLYVARCRALRQLGNIDAALADLDRAVAAGSDDFFPWLERADFNSGRGDNARALDDYNRAIEIEKKKAVLYINRASA